MKVMEAERAIRKLKKERDEAVEMLHRIMSKIEGVTRKENMSSISVAGSDLPVLHVGNFYRFDAVDEIAKLPGVRVIPSAELGWEADRVIELGSKSKKVTLGFHKVGNRYRLMKFCEEVV